MKRVVMSISLVLMIGLAAAGCGGPSATTAAPTEAPPAPTTSAPTAEPTPAPTEAPTAAPTEAPPTVALTATTPEAKVAFNWEPGSVPPADSDDVDEIALDLITHNGILGASGNEAVLNIVYDPTVITVEEIMAILKGIGHPVVLNE